MNSNSFQKYVTLIISGIMFALIGIGIGWLLWGEDYRIPLSPLISKQLGFNKLKVLKKYSFPALKKQTFKENNIVLDEILHSDPVFVSHLFTYQWDKKTISGLINIPKKGGKLPVVIMIRGYVDKEIYETGVGTKRAAQVFARNGFITVAPDFLGFGQSDDGSTVDLENRFNRPAQVIQLIASLSTLPQADTENIFMWGHSNGGQIALSILEITRKEIPTTLWAPVSKPFPYSVFYYMDELSDKGKYLRGVISEFEDQYNSDYYSIDVYFTDISAPLLIHQGTFDDYIPLSWSDELVERLKELEKDVTYYVYPGADHNMLGSWNTVVSRDISFFRKHID